MPFKNKYSIDDYNKAINLHKKGYGSQRIAKILGYKTRSAIEDWINKDRKPYYFSEKRINAINSMENIERIRAINKISQPKAVKYAALKNTKKLSKSAYSLNENLSYILGVIEGDGCVSIKQRRIILSVTDKDFALKFKESLEKWSGFKAKFYERNFKKYRERNNVKTQYCVYIDSLEASRFVESFDLNEIYYSNNKIISCFIKGFFDSEGTVIDISKKIKLGLRCFNTNIEIINFIELLLKRLNINSTITNVKNYNYPFSKSRVLKEYYFLSIYRKESIINFYSYIGFNINRKQQRLETQIKYILGRQQR